MRNLPLSVLQQQSITISERYSYSITGLKELLSTLSLPTAARLHVLDLICYRLGAPTRNQNLNLNVWECTILLCILDARITPFTRIHTLLGFP